MEFASIGRFSFLSLWLPLMGLDVQRWKKQVRA
jgi:hypothetical protein